MAKNDTASGVTTSGATGPTSTTGTEADQKSINEAAQTATNNDVRTTSPSQAVPDDVAKEAKVSTPDDPRFDSVGNVLSGKERKNLVDADGRKVGSTFAPARTVPASGPRDV